MRDVLKAVGLVLLLQTVLATNSIAGFIDGNELSADCAQYEKDEGSPYRRGYCSGYIIGVVDDGDGMNGVWGCFSVPDNAKAGQVIKVVIKWMNDYPEELHKPGDYVVTTALVKAFPCK